MEKLQKLMCALPDGIDAALIDSASNRMYFTGLESSAGILFATREAAYFMIDSRYIEAARKAVKGCEVLLDKDGGGQLAALAEKHGVRRVGVDSGNCTLRDYLSYCGKLPGCEIVRDNRVSDIINGMRMVKDETELGLIRRAQELTDRSFDHICGFIRPGMTEREIALELEFYSRQIGSECASFEFIVVSGSNSSLPHGVPGTRKVENGDFITMDFGCVVGGYHSDMTRTVAVGEPSAEMRKVYATVLEANLLSMASVKAGVPCAEVDKVARDIITHAGYGDNFGHGLGHSVGIEIHEEPRFSERSKEICKPGMIMTIEPGIYLEGRFGCRIEDMIYITEDGCVNLTYSSKELIVL